jgi:hypothetical protein
MAGYSGTPLAKKLGIKEGQRVLLVRAPAGFEDELEGLPETARVSRRATPGCHVIVCFVDSVRELGDAFAVLPQRLDVAGGLWIAWRKGGRGVVGEGMVREVGLASGLVDNKVCAVNQEWSGLRFVVRVKDRPRAGKAGGA